MSTAVKDDPASRAQHGRRGGLAQGARGALGAGALAPLLLERARGHHPGPVARDGARREELLDVIHDETGKPFAEIQATELAPVEMIVKYFTSNAHRILQDQAAWRPWLLFNKRTYVRYVPRGLIGLVTPWNLPFLIPLGDAFAAMLAGNAVLLKPSEWTTRIALWMEDAVKATGLLPDGLFAVVTGDATVGKQVVELADMILFTGSTKAGRLVGQARRPSSARRARARRQHPMVVLKDAAIERAAKAAVWGAFANCGQDVRRRRARLCGRIRVRAFRRGRAQGDGGIAPRPRRQGRRYRPHDLPSASSSACENSWRKPAPRGARSSAATCSTRPI